MSEEARAAKLAARALRPKLSAEEIAALRSRAAERIASGEAKAPPAPKVKADPSAQGGVRRRSPFLSGRQYAQSSAALAVAAGGVGYSRHVAKSDHKGLKVVAGAVGGAAAADVADTVTGAGLKRLAVSQRNATPVTDAHKATLSGHQVAHGMTDERGRGRHPIAADSAKAKRAYYRSMPTSLPGGRVQRLNALRDGRTGAVLAAGALAGGAYALHRQRVRKSAFGIEHTVTKAEHRKEDEAAAAAGGAAAGQGGYQAAGYQTKHYVDRHTRKGHPGVSPEQVKLQDKALSENKSRYGMRLPQGDPARNNVGYHRNYPQHLPYGKHVRALGHTHEGKLGVAVGAATTAVGAASAFGVAHHLTKPKEKS